MTAHAIGLLALAVWLWPEAVARGPKAFDLSTAAAETERRSSSQRPRSASAKATRILLAGSLGCAVLTVSLSPAGVAAALAVAVGSFALMHRSASAAGRHDEVERMRELPTAIDLMCLMLRSGAAPATAVAGAAAAIDGPLSDDLRRIASLQMMGAGTAESWRAAADDVVLAPVAAAALRSADSGSALADAWSRAAVDIRAESRVRVEVAAHRAGVAALAPLGLCFLPAFICLGVVPIVIGLAKDVFG